MIDTSLAKQVNSFLESGDRSFLTALLEMDRNDVSGQAIVRYLMNKRHWPFTPDSDFAQAIQHLFGEYPERIKRAPEEYVKATSELIKQAFDYECVTIVPEPRPEPTPKTKAAPKKSRKSETVPSEEEGESGSRTFKSIAQTDSE